MNIQRLLAPRTKHMKESILRELLKYSLKPNIISLAGGLPAPESFPLDLITQLHDAIIKKYGASVLQYGESEGWMPLREALIKLLEKKGIQAKVNMIAVGTGSQSWLDAVGKLCIGEGDYVAVEAPTYLGAIQAFNPYGPRYIQVDTDENGIIPDSLEKALKNYLIKIIYVVSNFQNPSGRTCSLERRKELARLAIKYDTIIVEDDPYGELRYKGQALPPIQSFAPEQVIYLSTLSKIFSPGMRLGYHVASSELSRWLVKTIQGVNLHTSTYTQALAAEYISGGHLDTHLPKIIKLYRPRLEAMLESLGKYFPSTATWSKPEGGMFVWVELDKKIDTQKLFMKAIEQNVSFVPGTAFFTKKGDGLNTMRLNFTNVNEEKIREGIKRLVRLIE